MKYMQANFDGCSLPSFRDFAPFCWPSKMAKFPFRPWTIVHGDQKIELAQKFIQVGVNVKCMQTNFGGRSFLCFRDFGDYSSFVSIENCPKL